jgi:hypothetical protein
LQQSIAVGFRLGTIMPLHAQVNFGVAGSRLYLRMPRLKRRLYGTSPLISPCL